MKKKLYLSWFCAECKKSGIAEVELPTNAWKIEDTIEEQHDECEANALFREIRNVEVAVK